MEQLTLRLQIARQALLKLKEALALPFSEIVRDAAIQRFEFSFETLWKASQAYLREVEGIDTGSPKSVVRSLLNSHLFNEDDAAALMDIIDERNLTVHTYNEATAQGVFEKLPQYAELMDRWLSAMEKNG